MQGKTIQSKSREKLSSGNNQPQMLSYQNQMFSRPTRELDVIPDTGQTGVSMVRKNSQISNLHEQYQLLKGQMKQIPDRMKGP
jgi:hypothetical protein